MLEYYYEVFFLIKYNYGVFDKMSIMDFLMKYNFIEFLMKCNYYGVSDKIIATMNKMMKAVKYNVNIAMC